jgi:two-component system nitrogen regulation response regulator GlnG
MQHRIWGNPGQLETRIGIICPSIMSPNEAPTLSLSNPTVTSHKPDAIPALTILWHPDVARVGGMFTFYELGEGDSTPLSRLSPVFTHYTDAPDSLCDPFLSRKPCLAMVRAADGVRLVPVASEAPVELDGKPIHGDVVLTAAELAQTHILTLGRRIILALHLVVHPVRASDDFGLLGHSDVIQEVRGLILSAAGLDLPVLIRGETGTGKDLTAAAIAKASRREPFVAVNAAALASSIGTAELFGYAKGAFTGATESRKGYFVEADGGTLFLDEIGLAIPEIQTALLRVLETGEVRGLGSPQARKVDVRVIAATDVQLEESAAKGTFLQPLLHRLSAFQIRLPPLRERRQDIGVLFLHFLSEILRETGELHRLQNMATTKRPWLTADVMTQVALAPWPGNVRQLRNFANQLAVANRGATSAHLDPTLHALLGQDIALTPKPASQTKSKPSATVNLSPEELLAVLERNDFQPSRAARELGISRTTMYELIRRDPQLRKATEISDDELRRQLDECNGDLAELSQRLHTSVRALQLRLRKQR